MIFCKDNMFTILLFLLYFNEINATFLDAYQVMENAYIDSNIIILNPNTTDRLYNKNHSWLVQFYKSPCDICVHFALLWRNLDHILINEWKFDNAMKLAVMDCTETVGICANITISNLGSPVISYFHEKIQDVSKCVQIDAVMNLFHLQNLILQQIISEQDVGRAKQFPDIRPYRNPSAMNLLTQDSNLTTFVILLAEKFGTFAGPQIILNLKHLYPIITIKYVYATNKILFELLKIKILPSIFVLSAETKTFKRYLNPERNFVYKIVKHLVRDKKITLRDGNKKKVDKFKVFEKNRQFLQAKINIFHDPVFLMDLETTLRWSFKKDICEITIIDNERYDALLNYMSMLLKYFPFKMNGAAFMAELRNILIISQGVINGSELLSIFQAAETYYTNTFVTPEEFLACNQNVSESEMYTCGLWKLFHYLTVKVDEIHDTPYERPKDIIYTIQDYVKNFITCTDCPQASLKVILDYNTSKIDSFDSAILWLWTVHNEANKKLFQQEKNIEYPKIQFPSKDSCTKCKTVNDTWNMKEVLRYLKLTYSSNKIYLIEENVEVQNTTLKNSSYFFFKSRIFVMFFMLILLMFVIFALYMKRGNNVI